MSVFRAQGLRAQGPRAQGMHAKGSRPQGFRATFVLHLHGLERAQDAAAGASDNYPPYDLLRVRAADAAGDALLLVFAVAGFGPDQLEITVVGDQLFVSGEQPGDVDPGRFLHRGIAARRFRRAFRLAPGLEVEGADLDRGLLSVALAARGDGRGDRAIAIGTSTPPTGP